MDVTVLVLPIEQRYLVSVDLDDRFTDVQRKALSHMGAMDNLVMNMKLNGEDVDTDAEIADFALDSSDVVELTVTKAGLAQSKLKSLGKPATAETLLNAAKEGDTALIELLADAGISLEVTCKLFFGTTPLMKACYYKRESSVKKLIELGADSEARDKDGRTPLQIASQYSTRSVIKALVEAGTPVDTPNSEGCTPLWIASYYGNTEVVETLAELGADLDKKDEQGYTPLLIASECGWEDTVNKLVEMGADTDLNCF
eukprot:TRINITY_DN1514_c0_g1_i1.p1 TRINITY_DN1514_c0_g1~~TRINITY_DN1514_c0_g1_i1.p1  ORF type:complete len:280 (+),score=68.19 TRINITY_DN1514_c0_g1_i1:71-841(+)